MNWGDVLHILRISLQSTILKENVFIYIIIIITDAGGCCPSATRKVIKWKIYIINKWVMMKYHALEKLRSHKWEGTFCIQAFIISKTMSFQYNCCYWTHWIQTTTIETISLNRMEMSEKTRNIRLEKVGLENVLGINLH